MPYETTITAITISLAPGGVGLANGAGRYGAGVDNSSLKRNKALISLAITSHASSAPTAGNTVDIYLLRSDQQGADIRDDGWGESDAANFTRINATHIGSVENDGSTGKSFTDFIDTEPFGPLGPMWSVGVVNNWGASLNNIGAFHAIRFRYWLDDFPA